MNAQWWTTPSAHPPHCYLVVCCVQEKGTVNAQWWTTEVSAVLGTEQFVKVGLRQMSGTTVRAGRDGAGQGGAGQSRAGQGRAGPGGAWVELSQCSGRISLSRSGSGKCQVQRRSGRGGLGEGQGGAGQSWTRLSGWARVGQGGAEWGRAERGGVGQGGAGWGRVGGQAFSGGPGKVVFRGRGRWGWGEVIPPLALISLTSSPPLTSLPPRCPAAGALPLPPPQNISPHPISPSQASCCWSSVAPSSRSMSARCPPPRSRAGSWGSAATRARCGVRAGQRDLPIPQQSPIL